jgi:hypothetical protein
MSPNRGAAVQAVVSNENNKRPIFDIMSENANRDRDIMVMRDLFIILDNISKWESNTAIHVTDVYQINTENFEVTNFMPGTFCSGNLE